MAQEVIRKQRERLFQLLQTPFPYLDSVSSRLFLVTFCAIFSTSFIIYFNPFNIKQIDYSTALMGTLPVALSGVSGALTLAFSQFFLRTELKLQDFSFGKFFVFFGFEILLLCVVTYILFGVWSEPFLREFRIIVKYTISLSILPYVLACLLIIVGQLARKVRQMQDVLPATTAKQLLFHGENGKLEIALREEEILYLKAEHNYVAVYHIHAENVNKTLVRNNLKKLEEDLHQTQLMRVHRSYMVNLDQVTKTVRKKSGYYLQLSHFPDVDIKVSESYREAFELRMIQRT